MLLACDSQNPPTPTASPTTAPSPSASTLPTPSQTPTGASPTPTPTQAPEDELTIVRTVPYATSGECGERLSECQQFVDVYAPGGASGLPVAVMVHGRPRTPSDMAELARAVAEGGAVVFNADYRGVRPVRQQGWPEAVQDVACAVRFARANAPAYGGDASRLVLVGHSFGGYVGTLVALAGDEFNGECLAGAESALPDAWVSIGGNCLVGVPPPPHPLWEVFYGGSEDEKPGAWEKGDPREHVGGNPDLVVRFIHERDDEIVEIVQPRTLLRQLRDAGYDVSLTVLEGSDHWAPLDVDGHGAVSRDIILGLLGVGG